MDHGCTLHFTRSGTAQVLHNTAIALGTAHHVSGTGSEPATASGLLAQLLAGVQRTDAGGHPSLLANRCFWRRDSCLDSCRLLVLFVNTWRPRRSRRSRRRSQRREGKHHRGAELVGAMALEGSALRATSTRLCATFFSTLRVCERSISAAYSTAYLRWEWASYDWGC
jgi:hypothetical protein